MLIATPEYNHTLSSVLKNAIDWISVLRPQPFDKKPIYLMSVAACMGGGARAQDDLRKAFVYLNPFVMPKPEI